jgi:hypothetical protein
MNMKRGPLHAPAPPCNAWRAEPHESDKLQELEADELFSAHSTTG